MSYELDFDLNALVEQVEKEGPDQSQAKKGPEKLPEGTPFLRMFGYIELGQQKRMVKGVEKIQNRGRIGFELSGPKYPPVQTDNGPKPRIIWTQEITLSQDDRSAGFKLFTAMNKGLKLKHFVQMIGDRAQFMGEIKHSEDGKYANLLLDSIKPAYKEDIDENTGDKILTPYKVAPMVTKPVVFVRAFATPAMWDELFIPGEYEAKVDAEGNITKPAQSKNRWQEQILAAEDAHTLPIYDYAVGKLSRKSQEAVDEAVGGTDTPPAAPPMDDFADDDIPF
ncbi:hypothetical protein [Stenotrophomonas phage BUCT603]|nr:hypothetical protein [Stenotrophomonas phage BUCT603]